MWGEMRLQSGHLELKFWLFLQRAPDVHPHVRLEKPRLHKLNRALETVESVHINGAVLSQFGNGVVS